MVMAGRGAGVVSIVVSWFIDLSMLLAIASSG